MWFSWFGYGITTPDGPCIPVEKPTKIICAPGGDEAVEQVLREAVVDLARSRSARAARPPRVVDVDVEAVLVRHVLVQQAAAACG